jgi:hypothetical protein
LLAEGINSFGIEDLEKCTQALSKKKNLGLIKDFQYISLFVQDKQP